MRHYACDRCGARVATRDDLTYADKDTGDIKLFAKDITDNKNLVDLCNGCIMDLEAVKNKILKDNAASIREWCSTKVTRYGE